jgi:hypothetical protein
MKRCAMFVALLGLVSVGTARCQTTTNTDCDKTSNTHMSCTSTANQSPADAIAAVRAGRETAQEAIANTEFTPGNGRAFGFALGKAEADYHAKQTQQRVETQQHAEAECVTGGGTPYQGHCLTQEQYTEKKKEEADWNAQQERVRIAKFAAQDAKDAKKDAEKEAKQAKKAAENAKNAKNASL